MTLPRATSVGHAHDPVGTVTLDYAARLLRRKRLTMDTGEAFLVDLAHTTHVDPGDAFLLQDGGAVEVKAADETLLRVAGDLHGDLARLAWHIGNRHTPCEIRSECLILQADPVLRSMLEGLGAEITEITGPFRPEGGAYGHGRTMGHAGGHSHDH